MSFAKDIADYSTSQGKVVSFTFNRVPVIKQLMKEVKYFRIVSFSE